MVDQVAFYNQQAENCGKRADEATLENEREKFRAAQAAWRSLADKMAGIRLEAAKRDAERLRS